MSINNGGYYHLDLGTILNEIGYQLIISANGLRAELTSNDGVNLERLAAFKKELMSVSYKTILVYINNCTYLSDTPIRYNPVVATAVYESSAGGVVLRFPRTSPAFGTFSISLGTEDVTLTVA